MTERPRPEISGLPSRRESSSAKALNEPLNRLVMRLAVRAEQLDQEVAERSFVALREVTAGFYGVDHQVVYGRRGAGKTHAFTHLASSVERGGDLAVYVDLRTIGSSGGLYGDTTLSMHARGTQLLIDVLEAIHTQLLGRAIECDEFSALLNHLDAIAEAASEVRVEGTVKVTAQVGEDKVAEKSSAWEVTANLTPSSRPKATAGASKSRKSAFKSSSTTSLERSGTEVPRVLFGRLSRALGDAAAAIAPRRMWILLDEWSSLPMELQPVLADMLRRSMFHIKGMTLKIGAIERRSRFIVRGADRADYLGIELGADTGAALNLDEQLTSGPTRSVFFVELLYRHLTAMMQEDFNKRFVVANAPELASLLFRPRAVREFVRAAEGVPRDAIQIASTAAQLAGSRPIGIEEIQAAARKFYLHDKETGIAGNVQAMQVWGQLQRDVVGERRSRTFLVRRSREDTHPGILDLYDARLIHLLQPGIASVRDPGLLYDGYCLDYGSYVNILRDAELEDAWNASGRPWEYRGGGPFLPDRFDETTVFQPSRPRTHQGKRAR